MSEVKMPDAKDYPSNSNTSREKKLEKIVQGGVKTRKKSIFRKTRDIFISEDSETIRSYILMDVIIPEIKEIIMESVNTVLFGGSRPTKKRNNGQSYVSYSSYSSPQRKQIEKRPSANDFNDVIFESRGEAEEVLSNLIDIIVDYGATSVADLYDLVGITGSFTDNKWGWTDLSGSSVSRARGGGYIINLPKASYLD